MKIREENIIQTRKRRTVTNLKIGKARPYEDITTELKGIEKL